MFWLIECLFRIRHPYMVVTEPTDALSHTGAIPSTVTVVTAKTETFISKCRVLSMVLCNFHRLDGFIHSAWWRHQMEIFPRHWPFVRGIHRSPVNSLHKGQWRGSLIIILIWARMDAWVNNRKAGDLRRHYAHNDATVMDRWNFAESRDTYQSHFHHRRNTLILSEKY